MKKPLCYLLAVVIALLLCACMVRSSYTVEKDGVEYLVDTKACTISDGTVAYPLFDQRGRFRLSHSDYLPG